MVEDPALLRRNLRDRRRARPEAAQARAAHAVAGAVRSLADRHRWTAVVAYLDHGGELATGPSIEALEARGVRVGVPRVDGDHLRFHLRPAPATLVIGSFGIAEPSPDEPELTPAEVDAALVPLVGFDDQGSRLGMGGGYYDRFLAAHPHIARIGLAHDTQRVARLDRRPWDEVLDLVLTPTMTVVPPRRAADSPLQPPSGQ